MGVIVKYFSVNMLSGDKGKSNWKKSNKLNRFFTAKKKSKTLEHFIIYTHRIHETATHKTRKTSALFSNPIRNRSLLKNENFWKSAKKFERHLSFRVRLQVFYFSRNEI